MKRILFALLIGFLFGNAFDNFVLVSNKLALSDRGYYKPIILVTGFCSYVIAPILLIKAVAIELRSYFVNLSSKLY